MLYFFRSDVSLLHKTWINLFWLPYLSGTIYYNEISLSTPLLLPSWTHLELVVD